MTDTLDTTEMKSGSGKLPGFLIVLLIITSFNIVYNIFNTVGALIAEENLEMIEEQLYESLEESGTDLDELPPAITEALTDFLPRFAENFVSYGWYQLFYYLLLIIPVFLMFKLRKTGFYLYALLQIIGTFDFLYFFGNNWASISVTIFFAIGAAVWILLYYLNLKHMR